MLDDKMTESVRRRILMTVTNDTDRLYDLFAVYDLAENQTTGIGR